MITSIQHYAKNKNNLSDSSMSISLKHDTYYGQLIVSSVGNPRQALYTHSPFFISNIV